MPSSSRRSVDSGDGGRHGHRRRPVGAGEEDALCRRPQLLAAEADGQRVAVGDGLAVAGEVRPHAIGLPGAAQVQPEASPHVVQHQDDALLVAEGAHALEEAGGRHLLVVEQIVPEGGEDDGRHLALVLRHDPLQALQVVVLEGGDKGALGGGDAGGDGRAPGVGAVVGAGGHDDLVAAGVGAGHG